LRRITTSPGNSATSASADVQRGLEGGLGPFLVAKIKLGVADPFLGEGHVHLVGDAGRVHVEKRLGDAQRLDMRLKRAGGVAARQADRADAVHRNLAVAHQVDIVRALVGLPLREFQRAGIGGFGFLQVALLLQHAAEVVHRPDQFAHPVNVGGISVLDPDLGEGRAFVVGGPGGFGVAHDELQLAQIGRVP
jgi:hypothetical protein